LAISQNFAEWRANLAISQNFAEWRANLGERWEELRIPEPGTPRARFPDMAPSPMYITLGKSWGGEDVLVVYNLGVCDAGLRTLREHATSYEDAQAEMLPYDINGDDCDDIKRAVFLIIHQLLCCLGVRMLCVQEPHEVFPEAYDLEDPEELARYEREVRVGDPKAFGGPEDSLELWCDEAATVFDAILSNSQILKMQRFHPVTAVKPSMAPPVAVEG
jgi:hypothetical protein